jgi:hypothetical protein
VGDVRGRHADVAVQTGVPISPADVLEVLLARDERPAAHLFVRRRGGRLGLESLQEIVHHVLRQGVALSGIHESEHDQVSEEHAPVGAEAREQPVPIELGRPRHQDVDDVRAVEALAFHDERLRPDHLLGGAQPRGHAEDLGLHRVREPQVVDHRDAAARAVDDVHEVVEGRCVGLAEPMGKGELRPAAHPLEHAHQDRGIDGPAEDVEVLGVALDARVTRERVRAADEVRHSRVFQDRERVTVETEAAFVDDCRGCHDPLKCRFCTALCVSGSDQS